MLKRLGIFNEFNFTKFSKEKEYVTCGKPIEWTDYKDKSKVLGTKVPVVIVKDNTDYGTDTETAPNLFEKLFFKIPKSISVPVNTYVIPVGPFQARVYGDYHNQLSIICTDIKIVPQERKNV